MLKRNMILRKMTKLKKLGRWRNGYDRDAFNLYGHTKNFRACSFNAS
jgi:hypothetical protein